MSTKGKYYRSKFRSNTIKIESNQSNEESVINIVNLPPEIYFSTASQFPMLSFNGNAKRKSTSITLDTKHSSSSNVCSQRLSVSNNYNDSKMSKSFRQDFKDNKNKKRIKNSSSLNVQNTPELFESITQKAEEILLWRKEILNSVEKKKIKWNRIISDDNEEDSGFNLSDVSSLNLNLSDNESSSDE